MFLPTFGLAANPNLQDALLNTQDNFDGGRMDGPSSNSSSHPGETRRAWRLVLLGGPGVGKGTQGELLTRQLEICHLSTGDLFRAAGATKESDQTPAIAQAMKYMRRGDLVPDSTVWEMVREHGDSIRSREGFLLDGFPRTLPQAEQLKLFMDEGELSLTAVLDYEMPESETIMRLSGRRICRQCNSVFHVTWRPPGTEGMCSDCGGQLYQRADDNPASIAIRLEAYKRSTAPLIRFYKDLGLLTPIDAVGSSKEVFGRTMTALQARA
jgi:adenylate kinase